MTTINEIKKDIESLRGSEVRIFGQPIILADSVDDATIDVLDVLDILADYEVSISDLIYDLSLNGIECDDEDDIIDTLIDWGYIDVNCTCDNTYNWSSPISNNLDFSIYDSLLDKSVWVELKVHRYGDVRGNYTDNVLLHFDCVEFFYEALTESNKYIDIDVDGVEYEAYIDILSDSCEVYLDGEYVCYAYGCDKEDIAEVIKEKIA